MDLAQRKSPIITIIIRQNTQIDKLMSGLSEIFLNITYNNNPNIIRVIEIKCFILL